MKNKFEIIPKKDVPLFIICRGQTVLSKVVQNDDRTLDISTLSSGLYQVFIEDNGLEHVWKFLKRPKLVYFPPSCAYFFLRSLGYAEKNRLV